MARGTVYVIDDDPALCHSTGFVLQSLGFEFQAFAGAEEFLAALAELQPGCVLTDLRMPAMDGDELKSAIAGRCIDWPVILMTSDGSVNADWATTHGFSGYLRKPFTPEELATVLDACFAANGDLAD